MTTSSTTVQEHRMTSIAIIGGTGYAGSSVAAEAVRRGHTVTAVARHEPDRPLDGVTYAVGSIEDEAFVTGLAGDHDVLVVAVHAANPDGPDLTETIHPVVGAASAAGARLGVVGGAGSSLVAEGGPRLFETEAFPEEYKGEATTHGRVLDDLRASDESLDWFYVSPPAEFGAWVPGETTGAYRTGGDVLVVKEDGSSEISGTDFALAFVDELEEPRHRRARFTVGH